MDVEVVERKSNPLLERDEIKFEVSHEGEPTPALADVKKLLRAKLNSKAELTVIDEIHSHFGSPRSAGFAKVYKNSDQLKRIEAKHILRKNFPTAGSAEGERPAEETQSEG